MKARTMFDRPARLLATALAVLVAGAGPASAATLCVLASPAAGNTAVTTSPNTYYAGVGTATAGSKTVSLGAINTAGATTPFVVGDEMLLVQMQDSSINASDSSAYGSGGTTGRGVTSDGTSGAYEYVAVTAVAGTTITVAGNGAGGGLVNTYHSAAATATQGAQTFQIVRVPRYNNATVNFGAAKAAAPWNGASGGIFAIDASGTVTVTGTVSVDGLGFRGGGRLNQTGLAGSASNPPYDFTVGGAIGYDGEKGEGTVGTPQLINDEQLGSIATAATDTMPGGSAAMGSPGNAGGGGTDANGPANDQNSGGGGGANGGDGGKGGNNWSPLETGSAAENSGTPSTSAHIFTVGGDAGTAFAPRSATRVVLGGGGGAGTINNNTGGVTGASGGAGGGLILVRAGGISGGTFSANGSNGVGADNDGGGGGGAGGSIVLTATGALSGVTANARGGTGGSTRVGSATLTEKHGPGGGGGGGTVITSSAVTSNVSGGANGTTLSLQYAYGATPGLTGTATAATTPTSIPGIASAAECLVDSLTITKTGTANASPGGLIAYSIVVSNAGPGDASGTALSDPLPSGITLSSTPTCATTSGAATCGTVTTATGPPASFASTIAKLPAGSSVTFTVLARAPTGTISNPYVNTATIAPPAGMVDNNPTTAQASTTVAQSNGINKTVRNVTTGETAVTADTGKPGDVLEYGLSFTNNTGQTISSFSVSDPTPANTTFVSAACTTPLPTGVTGCSVAAPAVGATGTVTYTYTGSLAPNATAAFTLQVKIN